MRTLRLCALMLLLPILFACDGSNPTESRLADDVLASKYGTARVFTGGNPYNRAPAGKAVDDGYGRAIGTAATTKLKDEIGTISIGGMIVQVAPGLVQGAYYGMYRPADDVTDQAGGYESVHNHEQQHRICHRLYGLDAGDCCRLQDHGGGYDINCRPLTQSKFGDQLCGTPEALGWGVGLPSKEIFKLYQ